MKRQARTAITSMILQFIFMIRTACPNRADFYCATFLDFDLIMNGDFFTDEVLQLGHALEKIDGNVIFIHDQISVQKSWGLKKGKTFKSIFRDTGACICTSKTTDIVTITGTSEQVAAARARVEGILALEKIKKSVQRETGARLKIKKQKGVVTIKGTSEQVAAAQTQVRSRLSSAPLTLLEEQVDVGDNVGFIIGKRGHRIKGIQSETGACLKTRPGSSIVTICGNSEQVAVARARVEKIVSDREQTRVFKNQAYEQNMGRLQQDYEGQQQEEEEEYEKRKQRKNKSR
ncbi:hypothetical protein TL16_g13118 [Triparma laevis f. inornata]|uniref:K Homology domain-containing protein n=1 Tax=Triparma laevis f. inornata TaxID=1714386 RepID=A0A9W7EYN7_9STRA|nr:hypothetical protein TL16_g13118 [Triparma laevis f. inornata]